MKKVFFGAFSLLLMACGSGNRTSENRQEDSLDGVIDSNAQVETTIAAAEQARRDSIYQDSLRQDSLRQASLRRDSIQKEFENQFITPIELVYKINGRYDSKSGSEIKKILKAKGYKIVTFDDGIAWSAKKESKNPITGVLYKQEFEVGCGARCSMSIEFANKQDAKKFYKALDKYNHVYQITETEFRKVWELYDKYIETLV